MDDAPRAEPAGPEQPAGSEFVRWVQNSLNGILASRIRVDGIMTDETREAVRDFQSRMGLPADGVVGPDTKKVLIAERRKLAEGPGKEEFATGWLEEQSFSDSRSGTSASPCRSERCAEAAEAALEVEIKDREEVEPAKSTNLYCRTGVKSFAPVKPVDLITLTGYGGRKVQMHALAGAMLSSMIVGARAAGIPAPLLLPVSGYRSRATQEKLWAQALAKHGDEKTARKWVCKPSHACPHLSGLAVDLWMGSGISSRNAETQRKTKAYQWLMKNAKNYGFTGYCPEPWHWEYSLPPSSANSRELEEFGSMLDEYGTAKHTSDVWRTRGSAKPQPELEELDPESPEHARWLQQALNRALGLRLRANAAISPAVRSALRSFQRRRGLPVDGELTEEVEAVLVAVGAPPHRHPASP